MSENIAPLFARIVDELGQIRAAQQKMKEADATRIDPDELRQAVHDIGRAYSMIGQIADVIGVERTAILESMALLLGIVTTLQEQLTGGELREQFTALKVLLDDDLFIGDQLVSVLRSYRDDQVLMRADVTRLARATEQVLAQHTKEDAAETTTAEQLSWRMGLPDRRSGDERRQAKEA